MEDDFTYEEIGAFLIAIGSVMANHNICAGAANDGESDIEIMEILVKQGIDEDRIRDVVAMPIQFAINYIAPIPGIENSNTN